jgi:magnesium and cobalt transporter
MSSFFPHKFKKALTEFFNLGRKKSKSHAELQKILETESDEPLTKAEREILSNFLKTRVLTVSDVMIERPDIQAVPVDIPFYELVQVMVQSAKTRLPVYRGTLDDVVGMVHIKDILAHMHNPGEKTLAPIIRPVIFVAPSMHSIDLLLRMRGSATHLALVVDEYGGIDGLVTLEGLIEQIVGEIVGEHETVGGPQFVWQPDNTLLADARIDLEDLFEEIGIPLIQTGDDKEIKTLGGLIFAHVSRIPGRGEVIKHSSGIEFKIIEADARRIRQVLISSLPFKAY